jgi:AraC family transcriptional regulator, melibiose operon regulatory protein
VKNYFQKHDKIQNLGLSIYSGPIVSHFAHTHLEIEFSIVANHETQQYFGGKSLDRKPGCLIVFWGIREHSSIDSKDGTLYHVIRVPLAEFLKWTLPDTTRYNILSSGPLFLQKDSGPCADRELMKHWIELIRESSENSIRSALLQMEARLLQEPECDSVHQQIAPNQSARQRFEKLALRALEQLANPIPISQIAEDCGMNQASASRLFKGRSGMTLQEFISFLRLEHSCSLMISTDQTIDSIAHASGYVSVSQYYSAFTKKYGLSPGQYREQVYNNAPLRKIYPDFTKD